MRNPNINVGRYQPKGGHMILQVSPKLQNRYYDIQGQYLENKSVSSDAVL